MPLARSAGFIIIRNLLKNITNPPILKDFYNAVIEDAKSSVETDACDKKKPPE